MTARTVIIQALMSIGFSVVLSGAVSGQPSQIALLANTLGAVATSEFTTPTKSVVAGQTNATSELLVSLGAAVNAGQFAQDYGLVLKHGLQSDPNTFVFVANSPARASELAAHGLNDTRVTSVFLNQRSRNVSYSFVSNDPLFGLTPGFGGEWQLSNNVGTGFDVNTKGAWDRDITGQGVTIGIVDDCLEWAHPDLQPNYSAANSYNFGSYVGNGPANDPSPVNLYDGHGASVAGIAAARGGNGIGVTGAAPYASLAGLRCNFDDQTTAQFVDATLYHSSGSDTSIAVKNHSYGVTAPYVKDDDTLAQRNALHTSTLAGTIHCFAAGNERGDANKKHLQSSPDAITVAAVASNGKFSWYSNYGANIFVAAPSSGSTYGIATTDLRGAAGYNDGAVGDYDDANYTSMFGGTSAASPLVAGVLALAKQVQPKLDTRFAKHLLARTSTVIHANDASVTGGGDGSTPGSAWQTNAAGYKFNQNYGFGAINADKLTQEAVEFSGVTPLKTFSSGTLTAGGAFIPDDDPTGVTRTTTVNEKTPLEEVLVTLNVTHTWQNDLTAWLTSPSGTTSRLFSQDYYYAEGNMDWQFVSNAFWGEDPYGTWSLNVADIAAADTGSWNSWALDLRMGALVPVPEPATAISAAIAIALMLLRRRRNKKG